MVQKYTFKGPFLESLPEQLHVLLMGLRIGLCDGHLSSEWWLTTRGWAGCCADRVGSGHSWLPLDLPTWAFVVEGQNMVCVLRSLFLVQCMLFKMSFSTVGKANG